jgi:hypothetical protein
MKPNAHSDTPEHPVAGNSITTEKLSAAASIAARPEAGTLCELRRLFGIPRSSAYELAEAKEITFVRLRKRGNVRGRVLVNFDSVRAYLGRCASDGGQN